jgi:hypothetical protein
MKSIAPLALALIAGAAAASEYRRTRPAPKEGFSYPECYRANRGERAELGGTACLRTGGRSFTALCDMSLNNPTWRRVREGCAQDGLSRRSPLPDGPSSAARAPG